MPEENKDMLTEAVVSTADESAVGVADEASEKDTEVNEAEDVCEETSQAEPSNDDGSEGDNDDDNAVSAAEDKEEVSEVHAEVTSEDEGKKKDRVVGVCEWIDSFVSAVVLCVFIFTFFIKSCSVDGTSMSPTYKDGQRVIAFAPYCHLKTGDVIVTDDKNDLGKPLFKRVIATEYQLVDMDPETGEIFIDGEPFDDPIPISKDNLRGDITYPFYVPGGCVFVMGDNRGVSNDSRFFDVGFLDIRSITGKVFG